jgi:NAD(P)-dependent dehydrogenase (short-subunit alcohol dehydrogenase family)
VKIKGSTALVTGANRGLGLAYARALLAAGAAKVYAAARDPASVKEPGLVPVRLDVTNAAEVEAAATACSDVDIVINNAGIIGDDDLLSSGGNAQLRRTLETNLFGVLSVSNAFAPVLKKNGGGALVNMLSALSWASLPGTGAYSVSKAAAWALTNGLRNELREQGTLVVAVHAGYIDTDMVANVTAPKSKPEDIAQRVIEALLADQPEVLADETSRQVKAGFGMTPPLYTQSR